jgi:hypothetical protein
MAKSVPGIDGKSLLEGLFRFLDLVVLMEQQGLAAQGFGIGRVLRDYFIHDFQGRLVLSGRVLLEGPIHLEVNGLATPLEFFAAAARAGGIGIERHARGFLVRELMGPQANSRKRFDSSRSF